MEIKKLLEKVVKAKLNTEEILTAKLLTEIEVELEEESNLVEARVKPNFADGLQEGIDYCQKQIDKLKEIYKDDPMYGLNAIQKYIDVRDHLKSKISV